MVRDEVNQKNKNEMIEVLVGDSSTNVWIPVMATDLRILDRDTEFVKVQAIRVRRLV